MAHAHLIEVDPLDSAMMGRVGSLRAVAWSTEIPKASTLREWLDEIDQVSRHWVIVLNGELLAAARMSVHTSIEELPDAEDYAGLFAYSPDSPIASLNRLVVAPVARRRGFSLYLDRVRLEAARESGCRTVVVATPSGVHRVHQLKRLGFTLVGIGGEYSKGPFVFRQIPATVMVLSLR